MNQCRSLSRASIRDRFAHGAIALHEVCPVDADDFEVRERFDQAGDIPACRVIFSGARNRVPVVFDHAHDGQLFGADRIHELPELALAGRSISNRHVRDFVVFDNGRRRSKQRQLLRSLGAAGTLKALHAGSARAVHDVQGRLAPVRRHHPAAGRRIVGGADGREQHLVGGEAQHERQRTIAIVRKEPVVAGFQRHSRGDEHRFMPGAADLEKDPALVLELDFLVVETSRQDHPSICFEEIVAGEAFVGARGPGGRLVSVRHRRLHSRSRIAEQGLSAWSKPAAKVEQQIIHRYRVV